MAGRFVSFWLLVGLTTVAEASIYITLTNTSDDDGKYYYTPYTSVTFYDNRFSSVNSTTMTGYLHQPQIEDGCFPIFYRPPNSSNNTWFALIQYFPTNCQLVQTVQNVKEAGYKLVIVGDQTINGTKTNVTLTTEVRSTKFPIILIDQEYVEYLIQNANSDFSRPEVKAKVNADSDLFILVLIMSCICVVLPLCMICCALFCYWRALRLRRYQMLSGIQRRHGLLSEHDRMARRELIDSILRQLQELQLEGEMQHPLGADKTKTLPTKKYETTSSSESCAICVEEFKNKDTLRILPCKHFFHIKCIDEWLTNHSDVCPLCKAQIPRDSDQGQRIHRGAPALVSFDETDETDSETLLGHTSRQIRPYGSV